MSDEQPTASQAATEPLQPARELGAKPEAPEEGILIRHEEQVAGVEKGWRGIGFLRARKKVDSQLVRELIPRDVENVLLERTPPSADDSGEIETLPDGSISIPVYEEELVVTKRIVLRERVIIRKEVVTEQARLETELRRERIELDADEGVEVSEDPGPA